MPRYRYDEKGNFIDINKGSQPTPQIISPFKDNTYDSFNASALFKLSYDITVSNRKKTEMVTPSQFEQLAKLDVTLRKEQFNLGYIFYSQSQKLMVIGFTGTWAQLLWAHNFDFVQIEAITLRNYELGVRVHRGIHTLYQGVQEKIRNLVKEYEDKVTQIIITGYSLGGALSNITAFDLADTHKPQRLYNYSFAAPAVGNPNFVNKFNQRVPGSWRVFNTSDVVPSLPLPIVWESLSRHVNRIVKKVLFRKDPMLFAPTAERENHIFQQVNHNYSFNKNLGQMWRNHETAYIDELLKK